MIFVLSNIKKLYDGTSQHESALLTNVDVLIENDYIIEVKAHDVTLKDKTEYCLIDCSQYVVTPARLNMKTFRVKQNGKNSRVQMLV